MSIHLVNTTYATLRYDLAACMGQPALVALHQPTTWTMSDPGYGCPARLLLDTLSDARAMAELASGIEGLAGTAHAGAMFMGDRYWVAGNTINAVAWVAPMWRMPPYLARVSLCLALLSDLMGLRVGEIDFMLPSTTGEFLGFPLPASGERPPPRIEGGPMVPVGDDDFGLLLDDLRSDLPLAKVLPRSRFFRRVAFPVSQWLAKAGPASDIEDTSIRNTLTGRAA